MFLGIDIGTSAVKAIIVDDRQQVIADAASAYAPIQPAPGISEQDPATWIGAVEAALGRLRAAARREYSQVAAIGLSGQMHSLVALDAADRPVRPAILWNDGRGEAECAELTARVGDLERRTGVIAMPGFTAAKLLWLARHEPGAFARIRTVLLAKDYVRLWLTGERITDVSDAAGTQLLDQAARRFAPDIVDAVGLRPEQLPHLVEGTGIAGALTHAAAGRLGLRSGTPVAAGGGDAATGAVGVGCIDGDQGFISLGTGTLFLVAQDRFAPRPETVVHNFAHCIPGRWYQMAAMLNGASCLDWAMRLVGETDFDAALAAVEAGYRGPARTVFLPYLTGERTPHNDPHARGVLFGLDPSTGAADVIQAVLEGVAYSLRDALLCLDAAGAHCPQPGLIGGGARSRLWASIVATVLERPVVTYRGGDLGPALGAARLAIVAATGAPLSETCFVPPSEAVFEPDPRHVAGYAAGHERFQHLYRALRPMF